MLSPSQALVLNRLMVATIGNDILPVRICLDHLALLGAGRVQDVRYIAGDAIDGVTAEIPMDGEFDRAQLGPVRSKVRCTLRWLFRTPGQRPVAATEAIIQAVCGLMEIHGRDRGIPRRVGLEVASVAAGILATQGVLAAQVARCRGRRISCVETSVIQAGLQFIRHHLAIGTCDDQFPFHASGLGSGPPFQTMDGHWIELEALTADAWVGFWKHLDARFARVATSSWLPFVYRYLAGRCSLPAILHDVIGRRTLHQLHKAAYATGISMCRVRTYREVLSDPQWFEISSERRTDGKVSFPPPWEIGKVETSNVDTYREHPDHRPIAGTSRDGSKPLSGFRVIEVASRLQGPLAGLLLHELGAEVIKVEPPGGDLGRWSPPMAGSLGAAYRAYNQGKHVIEINYKKSEGLAEIVDLAKEADVFLHNWPVGRAEEVGLALDDLARVNPHLVYAHASGWGRRAGDGPTKVAGDYLVQAHAACGDGINPTGEEPLPSRLTLVDVTGGLLACEGILGGLYLRERTGRGCMVNTSLLAAAMLLQAEVLRAAATGRERGRIGGRPVWGSLDQPLETADGFLVVAADDEIQRRRLLRICGVDSSRGQVEEMIAEQVRTRPAVEWERLLLDAGVPAASVQRDFARLPQDPHMAGLLHHVEGTCWLPGAPWRFWG